MTEYRFPDQADTPILSDTLSPLVNRLLARRDVTTETLAEYLEPEYDSHLHDPLALHQVEAACARIEAAIAANERIGIFSDYDCDGIPGAVVLHDFFAAIGYSEFQNYIPHRHYEGFGLGTAAIDALKADGVSLIITIDCGTSNVAEVAYAAEQGIDVIVTDHHEPGESLPAAVAVVNPKLGEYPFPDLCGAAVAFKLAQALIARGSFDLVPGWEKWWLDMVGIATIADMVPLRGENRVLARYGLHVLRKSRRPGLQQLLQKARVNQRTLTEDDIGFIIGPRINAASRMDTPEDAFFMLAETDVTKAGERVDHLEKLNTSRKAEVAQMTKELHKRVQALDGIPSVLVMGHTDWRPSLVGLAANKLAEEIARPVFLWGVDGNGTYKGSCRSGGDVSVVTLMQAASEVFLEHGGHHFSGGFSVHPDHIFTFGERLVRAMDELGTAAAIAEPIQIDAELSLEEVNDWFVNELDRLAPFGTGNPKPLFAFTRVAPARVERFGKGKEHTKLVFGTQSGSLEAIAFFRSPEQFDVEPVVDRPLTLIAHVERSFFMGRRQIRLRIVDII